MSCGEKNAPDAKFCKECGHTFSAISPKSRTEKPQKQAQANIEEDDDEDNGIDFCPDVNGLEFEIQIEETPKISLDAILRSNAKK
jgi:hypothetical protein